MLIEIELLIVIILFLISDIIFYIHYNDIRETLRRIVKTLKKRA